MDFRSTSALLGMGIVVCSHCSLAGFMLVEFGKGGGVGVTSACMKGGSFNTS